MKQERIGGQRLILGDCREVMADLNTFDCFLTDPPYGLGKPTGTISKQRSHKRDYSSFEDTEQNVIDVCVPAIKQALKICNGRGFLTPGGKNFIHYPRPEVLACFYQPASTGMCTWGRNNMQPIYYYGRYPLLGLTIQNTSRTLTERPSCKEHPCSKPLRAWKWALDMVSLSSWSVLDPFMGSGTTLVACQKMGRFGTGIEIDPEYFDLACRRVDDASRQSDLFIEPPKPKKQTVDLFNGNGMKGSG